jgi:CubicO group peptidase (beta-lactamase class C family)
MRHRVAVVAGVLTTVGVFAVPSAAPAADHAIVDEAVAQRRAADIRFTPDLALRMGGPAGAGLRVQDARQLVADAAGYTAPSADHPGHPAYAGAVVLVARGGVIGVHAAVGDAVRYGVAAGRLVELPPTQRVPMRPDTVFDIASLTKLFTTVLALRQVDAGRLSLDAPVARYLPQFAANSKARVTVRQVLTHTAGLPQDIPLSGDRDAAIAEVLRASLAPGMSPGNQYYYSDVGLITLGAVLERVTGQRLDRLVRDEVTGPLGMRDTGYLPPTAMRERIAATEYQPGRGMIRGEVHDGMAASLGGVAGNAGVFSTAEDLAVFAQMLLNGGRYGGVRILREETVRQMLTNFNVRFPGQDHGLGVELNQPYFMGPLVSPVTFGHTGFTGTSLVVDPRSQTILILLANQVHPDRLWSTKTAYHSAPRRKLATDVATAIGLSPTSAGPSPMSQGCWAVSSR